MLKMQYQKKMRTTFALSHILSTMFLITKLNMFSKANKIYKNDATTFKAFKITKKKKS